MYVLFGIMYISFFIVIKILKTVTPGFYDMCQRKFLRSAQNLALLCKDGDTENIHELDEPSGISYISLAIPRTSGTSAIIINREVMNCVFISYLYVFFLVMYFPNFT